MTDTRRFIPIALAGLFTIPGFLLRRFHPELAPPMIALITGAAIFGAALSFVNQTCTTEEKR